MRAQTQQQAIDISAVDFGVKVKKGNKMKRRRGEKRKKLLLLLFFLLLLLLLLIIIKRVVSITEKENSVKVFFRYFTLTSLVLSRTFQP